MRSNAPADVCAQARLPSSSLAPPLRATGPVTDERAARYPGARSLSSSPPPAGARPLLQIALDCVCVARARFVGILPGLLARTPLAQQVPAAVELDLDGAQPLLILLQPRLVCAVRLLATAKLVLLGYEALDPGRDALVAHRPKRSRFRAAAGSRYDPAVPHAAALVDEVANELATWPGVRIERRPDGAATVHYEHSQLGVLYRDAGIAELSVLGAEHDELIEHGDAQGADLTPASHGVSHAVHGPADVSAVLELFDRRYRDVRGEDSPYGSQDPA